jgi:threonine dehydrogenase-like Zn-dependent dehydrogenase
MRFYTGKSPVDKPMVRGHEFGGVVEQVGAECHGLSVGDHVVVNPAVYCGSCRPCRSGREHLCENLEVMGGAIDGAMQEKMLVPASNILPVPEDFDLTYAPLVETAAFARHVVTGITHTNVVIIGSGTIGLLEQQYCTLQNNRVICLDIHDEPLALSKRLGAEAAFNLSKDDATGGVKEYLGAAPLDTVIDNVCSTGSLSVACSLLAKGGTIVLVGIPGEHIELGSEILFRELTVSPRFLYRRQEFAAALDDVVNGRIRYRELVTRVFPLSEAKEAFEYKMNNTAIKVILKNGI